MYRPLRDLNGIPGSKSLIVCLTGYQRQDREDIMVCDCLFILVLDKWTVYSTKPKYPEIDGGCLLFHFHYSLQ